MTQRDELITSHRDYAHALARKIHQKLPWHVEFDEISAYADEGLVEAADNYDPAFGTQFKTFSFTRIRGAIFDGIREMSGLPRNYAATLAAEAGANRVEEETADSAETSDLNRIAGRASEMVAQTIVVVLLSQLGEDGDASLDAIADDRPPEKSAEIKDSVQRVTRAMRELPENHAQLLELLYLKQNSLTQCAKLMKVNKSTATRWHHLAVFALRRALAPDQVDLPVAVPR